LLFAQGDSHTAGVRLRIYIHEAFALSPVTRLNQPEQKSQGMIFA
jgi:hypothetical protein